MSRWDGCGVGFGCVGNELFVVVIEIEVMIKLNGSGWLDLC